jgi:hypothetical protein
MSLGSDDQVHVLISRTYLSILDIESKFTLQIPVYDWQVVIGEFRKSLNLTVRTASSNVKADYGKSIDESSSTLHGRDR